MSGERWFRGDRNDRETTFDWYALARERGLSYREALELFRKAVTQTSGRPWQTRAVYRGLLEQVHAQKRTAPGKRTRVERDYGSPAPWRASRPDVAPGKRTRTMTLAEEAEKRREARSQPPSEPFPGFSEVQAVMGKLRGRLDEAPAGDHQRGGAVEAHAGQADHAASAGWQAHVHLGPTPGAAPSLPVLARAERQRPTRPPPPPRDFSSRSGSPLPDEVRRRMERVFGHGFEHVRVHTDSRAAADARAFRAHAFTVGSDIFFGAGEWAPGTAHGDRLLAHELTHVVQSDEGRSRSSGMSRPDDAVEQEAYRNEELVVAALGTLGHDEIQAPPPPAALNRPAGPAAAIHRDAAPAPAAGGGGLDPDALIGPVAEQDLDQAGAEAPAPREQAGAGAGPGPAGETGSAAASNATEQPGATGGDGGAPPTAAPTAPGSGQAPGGDTGPAPGAVLGAPGAMPASGEAMGAAPASGLGGAGATQGPTGQPVTPAEPGSAAARAAAGIMARAEGFAAGIEAAASGLRSDVEATASQVIARIDASRAEAAEQIEQAFAEQVARVEAEAAAARAAVEAANQELRGRITAAATTQRTRIDAGHDQQASAARALTDAACQAVAAQAEAEAGRATADARARSERVRGMRDAHRGSGDAPLAESLDLAASRISERGAELLAQSGDELAERVRSEAADAQEQIRGHLAPYLASLAEGRAQAHAGVDAAEAQALADLGGALDSRAGDTERAKTEVIESLQARRDQALATVDELAAGATDRVAATRDAILAECDGQVAALADAFASECEGVAAVFSEAAGASEEAIAGAEAEAIARLDGEHARALGAIEQMRADASSQLGAVGEQLAADVAAAVAETRADLVAGVDPWVEELAAQSAAAVARAQEAIQSIEGSMAAGVDAWSTQAGQAATDYQGQVESARDEALSGLTGLVDEGLAKQEEQAAAVEAELSGAQSEIRGEYDSLKAEAEARGEGGDARAIHRSFLGSIWDFFSGLAEDVLAWFQSALGDVVGSIIGGILAFVVYAVGAIVVALAWVGAQLVNLVWGFIWGEVAIDVPGALVFAIIGDIIAGILVYGDLRDIFKHVILKWIMGEEITWVDWLIAGMAAASLILTLVGVGLIIDVVRGIVKGGLKAATKSILKELAEQIGQELAERLVREFGEEGAERLLRELGPELLRELTEGLGEQGLKELVEEFGERGVRELAESLGTQTLKELAGELGAQTLKQLVDELGAASLKELADAFGATGVKELADTLGIQGIKVLGVDALVRISTHLSPAQIADFVRELGAHATKKLAKRYGGEAMAHYGVNFFKTWKGVTAHTMHHLVTGNGIVNKKISGCHDLVRFVTQYTTSAATVEEVFIHSRNRVGQYVEYIYSTLRADGSGLPRAAQHTKTVVDGLEASLPAWKKKIVDGIDALIRNRTFPIGTPNFSIVIDGTTWSGFFRNGRIDSIFPVL